MGNCNKRTAITSSYESFQNDASYSGDGSNFNQNKDKGGAKSFLSLITKIFSENI